MRKEKIIETPRKEKIYVVYNNDDQLDSFIIEGTCLLNMKAYLMLRQIFSEDLAEKNCCQMILTLFDILPVYEE